MEENKSPLTCKAFFEYLPGFIIPAICDISRLDDKCDIWVVNRINVPIKGRGSGYGTKLMNQLTSWADENKQTLVLFINPTGPLTYDQLYDWYSRNGFEKDDVFEMKRLPKGD